MTNWYINRLRSFSILEFPYRIRQFVSKYFQSAFYLKKKTPSLEITSSAGILHYYIDKQETNTFPFEIFGKKFDYLGEIDWHKDIFSGKSFPRKFAKNIDIKSDEQLSAKVV